MILAEATLIELGAVLRDGMAIVAQAERRTDPALFETSYDARFATADGRWWRLVLTPEREATS